MFGRLFDRVRVLLGFIRDCLQFGRPRLNRITQDIEVFNARDEAGHVSYAWDNDDWLAFRLPQGDRANLFTGRIVVVRSEAIFVFFRVVRIRNDRLGRLSNAFAIEHYGSEYVGVRRSLFVRRFVGDGDRVIAGARCYSGDVNAQARVNCLARGLREIPFLL